MIEVPIRSKTSKKRLPDDDVEIGFRSYTFEELDKALKQTIKKYRQKGAQVDSYGIAMKGEYDKFEKILRWHPLLGY